MHKLISYAFHRNNLLFSDTGEIVVKGTSVYDIPCRLPDISGIVHKSGRISRAGTYRSLSRGQHRRDHSRSAGSYEKRDLGMLHHDGAGLHGRHLHRDRNIIGTACLK